ncbi:MAG TPA: SDR family NAD(P)-dependent oxidoreductase [Acidimicrobiales bacterium]
MPASRPSPGPSSSPDRAPTAASPATVFVTGAAGGVGSALVARLAAQGFRVVAGVRRESAAADLPPAVVPVVMDITDDESVGAAARRLEVETGPAGLQALVNVAGLMRHGPLELVPTATLREQFAVTVVGTMAVTRTVLPLLRRGGGRVVTVGAVTSRVTMPFAGPISAAESALASLTDALRMELRHQGVPVSLVELGGVATDLFAKAGQVAERDLAAAPAPLRELYAPALDAVAAAAAKQKLSPPDVAVEAIVKALTDRSPRPRYLAGRDARTLARLRRLPDGVRDRVLLRVIGVSRTSFPTPAGSGPALVKEAR